MRENVAIDDKLQGETRRYGFDWSPYLAEGDSIAGQPAAPEILYGGVDIGVNVALGNVQTFELSGGLVGPVALQLEIATAQAETLQQVVTLTIL
jgi:hypothetical protein